MDTEIDRRNSNHNNYQSAEIVNAICDDMSMVDIWRIRNPNERIFSWMRCQSKDKISASRIDLL